MIPCVRYRTESRLKLRNIYLHTHVHAQIDVIRDTSQIALQNKILIFVWHEEQKKLRQSL